jgi:hypothetical protein
LLEIPVDFSAALDKITGRVDNPCICFTCQLSGQNAAKKEKIGKSIKKSFHIYDYLAYSQKMEIDRSAPDLPDNQSKANEGIR